MNITDSKDNSAYVCFMIILKLLAVKNHDKDLEEKFKAADDKEVFIIKTAKRMGLKVRYTAFKDKIMKDLTVPVMAACKDKEFLIILGKKEDKYIIMRPSYGKSKTVR